MVNVELASGLLVLSLVDVTSLHLLVSCSRVAVPSLKVKPLYVSKVVQLPSPLSRFRNKSLMSCVTIFCHHISVPPELVILLNRN